jgi:NADP-dependent 3-hydroxy acid dehydrogenase YdfG
MSKTWLITGASAGLGRLMTERLLIRGDQVVATVRREDAVADLQAQHGDRLAVSTLDLTDTTAIVRSWTMHSTEWVGSTLLSAMRVTGCSVRRRSLPMRRSIIRSR